MKRILGLLVLLTPLALTGARGIDATVGKAGEADDGAAIRAVIGAQLAAFAVDDAEAAFARAAPAVKRRFGTADAFLRMVRTAYRPVYRPLSVDYGPLGTSPHGPVQAVRVVGRDGRSYVALYAMERSADGRWLVGGCLLRRLEGLTI